MSTKSPPLAAVAEAASPPPPRPSDAQTLARYHVLPLRRFRITAAPADAPTTAYVLDAVVESEIVKP